MSDTNNNRKTAARQANQGQLSHYEQAIAHLKEGAYKSSVKYGENSQSINPHTWTGATAQVGQAAWAGRKNYSKAAYHTGMGFTEGVSNQFPNSGQLLNNMKINQSIAQGRYQQDKVNLANQVRQNNAYIPKANQMNQQKTNQPAVNKGIESMRSHTAKAQTAASSNTVRQSHNKGIDAVRQRAAAKPTEASTGKSSNKGIASYQSKASGQSANASKSGASGQSKGSSASSSSGKSSGGQGR
jgi:hypothetical protein